MNKPTSSDTIDFRDIHDIHEDVAKRGNNLEKENLSRGVFGNEHIVDSVYFSARDFNSQSSDFILKDGALFTDAGSLTHEAPMGPFGDGWLRDTFGPDFTYFPESDGFNFENITRDWNDSVSLAGERATNWVKIPSCSSKTYSDAMRYSDPIWSQKLEKISSSPASGSWSEYIRSSTSLGDGNLFWQSKFGAYLFKIGNDGRPFSLFFYNNFEVKTCVTFPTNSDMEWDKTGKNRFAIWQGGSRFWTSVVYFLLPNPSAPFVLKWAPRHMIGCSAGSYQEPTDDSEKTKGLGSPMINEIHSYQDVIQVNNTFIKSLCAMSGVTYTEETMGLSEDASFGWATLGGIDRWDGRVGSKTDERVDAVNNLGKYTYDYGQPVIVDNASCGYIAFDYDCRDKNSDSRSEKASSSSGNVSLFNNFIGL